jgi:acyl-CoA synthetase (AMP-forming)/AMP-acid ligase II
MNLSLTLLTMARAHPSAPALTSIDGTIDYAEFERRVASIAGALRAHHAVGRGTRVAIAMANCGAYLELLYGIWRAGAAAIPINAKLHAKEIAWIVADSGAKLVFADAHIAGALTSLGVSSLPQLIVTGTPGHMRLLQADGIHHVETAPEDELWLFYTSGTTGRPKGAILTHRNALFACHAYYADIDYLDPRDTYVSAAPLSHGAGLYALAHVARGAHNVVLDGFEPAEVFNAIDHYPNVSMFAAPTMVSRLIHHPAAGHADTRNLKTIIYGGAPMYVADLKRALDLFGPKLYQLYGQGESPMTITGLSKAMHADAYARGHTHILASAGIARTGVDVRCLRPDGSVCEINEPGEITTRSDCVMRGYWNNPAANAAALRNGWLWTGDVGAIDQAGVLTLMDRSKDMIISGGSNIYPREIEDVLLMHQGVLECAVVGRPHADWGEEVIAFVVPRAGACPSPAELDRLCIDNIARFKRPKGYRVVESLPKNNYGKILKTELRAHLEREDKIEKG